MKCPVYRNVSGDESGLAGLLPDVDIHREFLPRSQNACFVQLVPLSNLRNGDFESRRDQRERIAVSNGIAYLSCGATAA